MPSVENTVENTVENPIKRRPSGPSPSVFRQARHGNNDVTVLTREKTIQNSTGRVTMKSYTMMFALCIVALAIIQHVSAEPAPDRKHGGGYNNHGGGGGHHGGNGGYHGGNGGYHGGNGGNHGGHGGGSHHGGHGGGYNHGGHGGGYHHGGHGGGHKKHY